MKYFILILILVSVLAVGCAIEEPIGGERGEHGCLGSAGYQWDENIGACIRDWEFDDNKRSIAKEAVKEIGSKKGLTIVDIQAEECLGCFAVKYDKYGKLSEKQIIIEHNIITDFEECAAAGNPVMESHPRQCRADGQTFVEELSEEECEPCVCGPEDSWCESKQKCLKSWEEDCPGTVYTYEQARAIALNSGITEDQLTGDFFYNENTETWWLDLNIEKEGCMPAIVVDENAGTAEINWRCTGLIPE